MTVNQLLSSLDSAELTEWMAHFSLESEDGNAAPERSEEEIWRTAFNAW